METFVGAEYQIEQNSSCWSQTFEKGSMAPTQRTKHGYWSIDF